LIEDFARLSPRGGIAVEAGAPDLAGLAGVEKGLKGDWAFKKSQSLDIARVRVTL
jgi:hypothetical protein